LHKLFFKVKLYGMRNVFKKIVTLLLIIYSLSGCASKETNIYTTPQDLNGQKIGVLTGTVFEDTAKQHFPDSEIVYFATLSDEITALKDRKIEGFITDYGIAVKVSQDNSGLIYFPQEYDSFDYSLVFTKNEEGLSLRNEFDDFLDSELKNVDLNIICQNWTNATEYELFDYESLPNINGEIKVATDGESFPFVFMHQNKLTGIEVELLYKFAQVKGYALRIDTYNFSGMLAAIASEKYQVGASGIVYSEERAQKFYFSKSYLTVGSLLMVREENIKYRYQKLSDLSGKDVSCISGTIYDTLLTDFASNVTFHYFDGTTDEINALLQGKVVGTIINSNLYNDLKKEIPNLYVIGSVYEDNIGFIFEKSENPSLLNLQIDEYIKKIKGNGELDKITEKWYGDIENNDIDYSDLEAINGVIHYALSSAAGKPMCYMLQGKYAGIEVELLTNFAREYGYGLEIQDYSFSGVLTAVSSGKADMGGANITISDERKKAMNFSIPFVVGQVYAISVDTDTSAEQKSLIEKFKDGFNKTFIYEERYKLFVNGVKTTVYISLCSCVLGSILGFVIYFLFRNNNGFMSKLLNVYSWFVTGLPTVVLLMIFYYVVFVKSSLSAQTVSIIAFSILFSLAVFGLLKTCFMAIDKGQFEAGYALGYSKSATISKIIIPEIAPMFFPAYRSALVDLIKTTSIVGYIAVQDLTKVSDIIRSRTYDAFFPLIAITIIYFLVIVVLDLLARKLEKRFNTRNRKRESILKGVKIK